MKKSVLFFAALVCMMFQTMTASAHDRIISAEQLPAAAITFLQQNFPGEGISYVILDKEFSKTSYEVYLENGMEMEFDEDGDAYMVDCNFEAVPSCVVPGNIAHYIRAKFPGAVIVKIERDRRGYDVDLSNGLEVHFNYDGRVIDVDD